MLINWVSLLATNEIYALVVKGTVDIQGLVAINRNDDFQATYISWMVAAPANNKLIVDIPKYKGVGGHLFAIAISKSCEFGYGGAVTGFAADEKLLEHYVQVFHANPVCILHPYQFVIEENFAKKIAEEYTYEWTDDEL